MRRRILDRILELYDRPVMQNNHRSTFVEYMVAELLGDGWSVVGANWMSWDLEGPRGARVEVKQAAARQSWDPSAKGPAPPNFDIALRSGYWKDEQTWVDGERRPADVYVFCWHPRKDDGCDHRRPDQWRFFVVRSRDLPDQKTLSMRPLRKLAPEIDAKELPAAVAKAIAAKAARR